MGAPTEADPSRARDRKVSPSRAWLRALELTAPIAGNPQRTFPTVIAELAQRFPEAPALVSERESLTYRALSGRANRYARWALGQRLAKGETVGLLMPNRPEYVAVWLGITEVGGVVALLNTNLEGRSLAHCINLVDPRHVIVAAELMSAFASARPYLSSAARVWSHGPAGDEWTDIAQAVETYPDGPLNRHEAQTATIEDHALHVYTSGTTGLPKAAKVTHFRVMVWAHWFAGMMATTPDDRMYNCLPMYHSIGGVVAIGAALVNGGSVLVREKFSARHFWDDVVRWDCTLFQYIGELCRYLLQAPPRPTETTHRLRLCCGNGLRPDVWNAFKERFRIPQILEFYAATEGNVSLFNVEEERGSIGRLPPFLAHRAGVALVELEVERGEPLRGADGFCVPCAAGETGEAIGRISKDASTLGGRFDGYTSREDSERKLLRDVFRRGDLWFRTGDLMRKDDRGFFYFVDRVGDTFRWKGENVSTCEVAEALAAFPGIAEADVYGVTIPGAEGRAGMAALVATNEVDLAALYHHLADRLPAYARPLFLRLCDSIEITPTFKHKKADLIRDGYDPAIVADRLFFRCPEQRTFVPLDRILYDRIRTGQLRL